MINLFLAIAIKIVVMLLVGAFIRWVCERLGFSIPAIIVQLYLLLVALIAVSMAAGWLVL